MKIREKNTSIRTELHHRLYELIGLERGLGFLYTILVRVSRCCFSPDSMAPVNRVLLYRYRNTESRVQVYQNSKTGHELQFKANCFILGVFVNITIKIKNTTLCIIQTFAMWGKMMLPSWRNRLLKISLIFFF